MSGCTLVGLGLGGAIAGGRNSDPSVAQGHRPRTPVGKSMALGAGIGLAADIGLIALTISQSGGSFGH